MIKPEEFNDWYTDIVENAGMCDKRYPVKGMNIWTGYGWKTMQLIDKLIREQFDDTGHDEVHFPLLIPETEFKKEEDHIQEVEQHIQLTQVTGKILEMDL